MWACIFDEGEKKGLQKKKVEAPSIRLGDFTMALGWLRMRSPPRRLQGPGNLGDSAYLALSFGVLLQSHSAGKLEGMGGPCSLPHHS